MRLISLCLFVASSGFAFNNDDFISLVNNGKTLQGSFSQITSDDFGNIYQYSAGKFLVKRPKKFIWQYDGDDGQKIISTGKRVWLIQPDLQQVSHLSLESAMQSSPVALLLATKNIPKFFKLVPKPKNNDLAWLELIPHDKDNINFEQLLVGYDQKSIKVIKVKDSFNRTVTIRLIGVKYNLKISDALFLYLPPY